MIGEQSGEGAHTMPQGGVPASGPVASRMPVRKVVHRIAAALQSGRIPPGDVAGLRRIEAEDPSTPAFWKVLSEYVLPGANVPWGGPDRDVAERRWAIILNAMAHMVGLNAPGHRLGKALADAGFSEMRLVRLLRAREDSLATAVRTTARFLAAKAQTADQAELADLVLSDGHTRAESVRRRIARSYFTHAQ